MTAFGYMAEIARAATPWLAPSLVGQAPDGSALLPYWLGAAAIAIAPAWADHGFVTRIPFALLLALTLAATWYAAYHLARSPQAQPVAFAFGGEAQPTDYARAMADGAVLALLACLGLAQLSHETTPALAQLGFTALSLYALSAGGPQGTGLGWKPVCALVLGLLGLALSGAPFIATCLGLGAAAIALVEKREADAPTQPGSWWWVILAAVALAAASAWALDLWRWHVRGPDETLRAWRSLGRLLLWFAWPAWALAAWTVWRWRRQLRSRHVALPIWFALVAVMGTLVTPSPDRTLLLGLPALGILAAFALPTFKRSFSALIDWFTLLFFSGSAILIWVIWIAMQTGVPRQPAANVTKLAPGFEPSFSALAFVVALTATIAWGWLVLWRVGRHRPAIWKSLVLPASGAALSWLLLMTLWLPLLDFARSYAPLVRQVARLIDQPGCVETHGLSRAQSAAFQHHGKLVLQRAGLPAQCPWLIVDNDAVQSLSLAADTRQWKLVATVRRPTDSDENILLFRRAR